jgi:hypothetical protein
MRTKALFVAAAFVAAGIVSSMAQVYSVNVVGYVNKVLTPGYNLIANPLETTANRVEELFAGKEVDLMSVYKYVAGTGYTIANYSADLGEWDNTFTIDPGEGVFVYTPEEVTVTFVGEITEGAKVNNLPTGWSMKSSMIPQGGALSALGYVVADLDSVYIYNNTATPPGYVISNYSADLGEWDNGEPVLEVGDAFFLFKATPGSWERTFTVSGQ